MPGRRSLIRHWRLCLTDDEFLLLSQGQYGPLDCDAAIWSLGDAPRQNLIRLRKFDNSFDLHPFLGQNGTNLEFESERTHTLGFVAVVGSNRKTFGAVRKSKIFTVLEGYQWEGL
jgi:hypothetical protein